MDLDKVIGANMVRARKAASDMPQVDLAEQMRDKGFKWSQATVWEIERGKRPLRLSEAWEASKILNLDITELVLPSEQTAYIAEMDGWQARLNRSLSALRDGMVAIMEVHAKLPDVVGRLRREFPSEWQNEKVQREARWTLGFLEGIAKQSIDQIVARMLDEARAIENALVQAETGLTDDIEAASRGDKAAAERETERRAQLAAARQAPPGVLDRMRQMKEEGNAQEE